MRGIRVASVCFVAALGIAPPAYAQNGNSAAARIAALEATVAALQSSLTSETNVRAAADTTLQGQIDKLKGNIVPGDLVGTYAVHFVATAMDGDSPNQLTSYTIKGTATLSADNTGFATLTAAGIAWTEGTPLQNWVRQEVGGVIEFDFTWSYSNGTVSTASDNDFGNNNSLNVVAGGQVMVSAEGGAPSNNQLITVWTRKLP